MGILTDKVGQGLEGLSTKFKDRLRGWAAGVIGFGFEVFADIMAKSASAKMSKLFEAIQDVGELPPAVKEILDEAKSPTGEAAVLALSSMGARVGGAVTSTMMETLLRPWRYLVNRKNQTEIYGVDMALASWLRGNIPDESLKFILESNGFNEWYQTELKKLLHVILPSDIALEAWLRDKAKYQPFVDNLPKLGLDAPTIELLTELAYKIPGVGDVIRYSVKEAYSPEIYKAFGQDTEFPTLALEDAEKAGVRQDHLLKEWIAHWDLPGVTQGYDMFHRGIITMEQLKLLLKARDIMPFWRDKLIGLSWDLPNRIELRMMARYGLIDKPQLMEILEKIGVDPQYRSLIADMNLSVGLLTDLRTRYANGYITAEGVKTELTGAGLATTIVERLYQYIVKVEKPARVAAEKDLTKAEIIKGVKLGIITWEEGVAQLEQMGYDESEAMYILAINIEVAAGSPHNLGDFKRLTDLARAAQGLPTDRTLAEIAASEKAAAAKYPVQVKLSKEEYDTRVKTIRWRRTHGELTRDEEVTALLGIGVEIGLAGAYADYDGTRPGAKKED